MLTSLAVAIFLLLLCVGTSLLITLRSRKLSRLQYKRLSWDGTDGDDWATNEDYTEDDDIVISDLASVFDRN